MAPEPGELPDVPLRHRRSAPLAIAGLLLLVTSLLLPWWTIRYGYAAGQLSLTDSARPFVLDNGMTIRWTTVATGLIAAAACVLLFLRIAGKEWRYNERTWRLTLTVAVLLTAAAFVSALAWPKEIPAFWGSRSYVPQNVTVPGGMVVATARPGLGWWIAGVALLCIAAARRLMGPAKNEGSKRAKK